MVSHRYTLGIALVPTGERSGFVGLTLLPELMESSNRPPLMPLAKLMGQNRTEQAASAEMVLSSRATFKLALTSAYSQRISLAGNLGGSHCKLVSGH